MIELVKLASLSLSLSLCVCVCVCVFTYIYILNMLIAQDLKIARRWLSDTYIDSIDTAQINV